MFTIKIRQLDQFSLSILVAGKKILYKYVSEVMAVDLLKPTSKWWLRAGPLNRRQKIPTEDVFWSYTWESEQIQLASLNSNPFKKSLSQHVLGLPNGGFLNRSVVLVCFLNTCGSCCCFEISCFYFHKAMLSPPSDWLLKNTEVQRPGLSTRTGSSSSMSFWALLSEIL